MTATIWINNGLIHWYIFGLLGHRQLTLLQTTSKLKLGIGMIHTIIFNCILHVSGFATDCPYDVWCRGLTSCLMHVAPPFGSRFINTSWAVGLTYWIVYFHFFCILTYAIIYVLIHHIMFMLYLYFLIILYFFKYFCTNIFHRRSLCTFYYTYIQQAYIYACLPFVILDLGLPHVEKNVIQRFVILRFISLLFAIAPICRTTFLWALPLNCRNRPDKLNAQ